MAFARFLVYDTSNCWTVALRWVLTGPQPQLAVVQDLDDCWQMLADSPASFVALELNESNLESVVRRIQDLRGRFPQARAAVMCDRALGSSEWLVREAGASHVAVSIRELSTVVDLARRHLARIRPPELGIRQRVWDRLAWQDS